MSNYKPQEGHTTQEELLINCQNGYTSFVESTDCVKLYYKDVRKYPLLDKEETKRLFNDIRQDQDPIKKEEAMDRIIGCNQRFVISMAKKLGSGHNHLDLVGEGNLGLMDAIERFDPATNNSFLSYAVWWVRRRMVDYLTDKETMVRIPEEKKETNLEEVTLGYKDCGVLSRGGKHTFLSTEDTANTFNDGVALVEESYEYTKITADCNIENDMLKLSDRVLANTLMGYLSEEERDVVNKVIGINCEKKYYYEIAREKGCTPGKVRKIYDGSLKKMRSVAEKGGL
ncbi:MAG: sigma-70 family RNA polymerase sigma factor [Bacteroidales bacterium]|nr:sigma-70 family RNA polymerase sigma factor [Bacteroidales bacterium]